MITRKEYLAHKVTHREYFAQFVSPTIKDMVRRGFGRRLWQSTDPHLNDIPLHQWDMMGNAMFPLGLKAAGEFNTPAIRVCILKEAARQVIEEGGVNDRD